MLSSLQSPALQAINDQAVKREDTWHPQPRTPREVLRTAAKDTREAALRNAAEAIRNHESAKRYQERADAFFAEAAALDKAADLLPNE